MIQTGDAPDPHRAAPAAVDPLHDRVERLLLRFEEMKRTLALQNVEIERLKSERTLLENRLKLAGERVQALIDQLPKPSV